MSGRRAGSGARSRRRAEPVGRPGEPAGEGQAPPHPLVAAAQLLLGICLSCLIAALGTAAVIGAIALVIYLAK